MVIVQKLMDQFGAVTVEHMPQLDNRHRDALAPRHMLRENPPLVLVSLFLDKSHSYTQKRHTDVDKEYTCTRFFYELPEASRSLQDVLDHSGLIRNFLDFSKVSDHSRTV